MRKFLFVLAGLLVAIGIAACGGNGNSAGSKAYQRESHLQGLDAFNLTNNQPLPVFTHSQIRQELIDIEEAQAGGVQSTTFFMPNNGPPQGSCPSIGAPVSSDTQLSNPYMQVRDPNNGDVPGSNVLPQIDPDGVYTGQSTGTYVMCVDPSNGVVYPQYWEGYVRVVFGPAVWDNATNSPKLVGEPTHLFNNIKTTTK